VTHEYPSPGLNNGGIGTFVQKLGHALVKVGVKVSVIGLFYEKLPPLNDQGINVIRKARYRGTFAVIRNALMLNKEIKKLHKISPINVLETSELGLAFIWKLPGIQHVIRMHGGHHYFAKAENRPTEILKVFQEKRSFAKADHICAVSNYVGETTRNLLKLGNRKITVIYNPLNVSQFKQADYQKAKPNTLVYVGSLVEKKGVRQLVKAMKHICKSVPDAQLRVVGRSGTVPGTGESYMPILEAAVDESTKDAIDFTGPIPHSDIPNCLEEAEICVYPSHMEAMPMAWLEALGMGKPFVGSITGPGPEAVHEGLTGLLPNPHDPKDIADKVIYMLKNKEEAQQMGIQARKDILKRFNLDSLVDDNFKFYKSICE